MHRFIHVLVAVFAIAVVVPAWAEIRLPALFTDHMVLQRDVVAPVWGWADAGAEVTVRVAGQTRGAVAGDDGRWQVELDPMKAGGPHHLVVQSGNEAVTVRDVLVGEVWIGSGQSNMQWPVRLCANPELEIKAATYPKMRLFYVPRVTADTPQTDVDAEWTECTPETVEEFSAVLYYFGRDLHGELDVPIGLVHTSWGGTPAESWASRESLEAEDTLEPLLNRWDELVQDYPEMRAQYEQDMEAYREAAEAAKKAGTDAPSRPNAPRAPDHPHRPASLYNAMIAPLVPYAFQGAIWYQGESNASRAYQYRTLFPLMIENWRETWGGRDFPFLFVQLANYTATTDDANKASDWAELREAQTMTLDLDNTGMAVIIDIGEADDIHPKNKQDVGKRLALAAFAETYGKDVPYSGPMYATMSVMGSAVRLKFDHVYDGLVAKGGALSGFAVAGPDKTFVWADARIDGDTVVVSAEGVESPVAVRYAWANNPQCNLYNSAGLPASPFRTDDWPGVTVNNH